MITVLRRQFKGSIKYILWVIMGAFVIGMMPLVFRQAGLPNSIWAIRVNNQEIGYKDFVQEVEKQKQRILTFRQQYGEYADWLLSTMGSLNPKDNAYKILVRQELITQFADKIGIHLNPEYVAQRLADRAFVEKELAHILPIQLIDEQTGAINELMLRQYLRHFGLTTELFERLLERELIDKLALEIISSGFYVPEFDLKQRFLTEYSKKSFSILKLTKDSYLAAEKKITVAKEDLQKYYDEQNAKYKRYWTAEKRSGKMWTFDPATYGIQVTDEQIQHYYEQNKVKLYVDQPAVVEVRRILFTVPDQEKRAKVQVRAARTKDDIMQNPAMFAQIAKERSEDAESAKNGGLLKPFKRGEYQDQAFDRAAFTLQEDGAVSDVIETKDGFEILQRVSKKSQSIKPLSAVHGEIKKELIKKQFEKQFAQELKHIIQLEEQGNAKALEEFILEHGGKAEQIKDHVLDESTVGRNLFKLAAGQTTFFVEEDKGVAIKLTEIKERYLPTLDTIESAVLHDYYDDKAVSALKEAAKNAKAALEQSSIKEVQATVKGELIQTGLITSKDEQGLEKLSEKGIQTAQMFQLEKPGAITIQSGADVAYVFRLDEVSLPSEAEFNEKRGEILEEFESQRMRQYLEGFVASLHRNATIETNESVVTLQD